MGGIQTGLTDAELLASQLKAHELVGLQASASEIDNSIAKLLVERDTPSGFDLSLFPKLKVWKNLNSRTFVTNARAKRVCEDNDCDKVYYVDIATGSDTNDGITKETAFKTIYKALSINFNYKVTIYVKAGIYIDSDGWNSSNGASSMTHLNVIGYDGEVITERTTSTFSTGSIRCGKNIYCENISFIGGKSPFSFSKILDVFTIAYFKNCKFNNSIQNNGLEVTTNGLYILENCESSGNIKDGFNYHGALDSTQNTLVIEINCKGFNNGSNTEGTNNGSTAHESVNIIRVNGEYYNNQNRNIHDVGDSRSWNLGVYAHDNQAADGNFTIDIDSTNTSIMWLDTCKASGDNNQDYRYFNATHPTSFIYAYDFDGSSGVASSSGSLIYYDPIA